MKWIRPIEMKEIQPNKFWCPLCGFIRNVTPKVDDRLTLADWLLMSFVAVILLVSMVA
jgi:hypothetical protein